ncbi:hypothetical protein DPEC_G00205540 [Dallia pectoralis]|uniref:Uncharacterized protein n=1 Tax=Dallia pectoralis TaxID=75939 RepID=A0ACC2G4K4_DALPE|nr:hypothetical protein DPEC_G00205540 [Dallia pectoralis]
MIRPRQGAASYSLPERRVCVGAAYHCAGVQLETPDERLISVKASSLNRIPHLKKEKDMDPAGQATLTRHEDMLASLGAAMDRVMQRLETRIPESVAAVAAAAVPLPASPPRPTRAMALQLPEQYDGVELYFPARAIFLFLERGAI